MLVMGSWADLAAGCTTSLSINFGRSHTWWCTTARPLHPEPTAGFEVPAPPSTAPTPPAQLLQLVNQLSQVQPTSNLKDVANALFRAVSSWPSFSSKQQQPSASPLKPPILTAASAPSTVPRDAGSEANLGETAADLGAPADFGATSADASMWTEYVEPLTPQVPPFV